MQTDQPIEHGAQWRNALQEERLHAIREDLAEWISQRLELNVTESTLMEVCCACVCERERVRGCVWCWTVKTSESSVIQLPKIINGLRGMCVCVCVCVCVK